MPILLIPKLKILTRTWKLPSKNESTYEVELSLVNWKLYSSKRSHNFLNPLLWWGFLSDHHLTYSYSNIACYQIAENWNIKIYFKQCVLHKITISDGERDEYFDTNLIDCLGTWRARQHWVCVCGHSVASVSFPLDTFVWGLPFFSAGFMQDKLIFFSL